MYEMQGPCRAGGWRTDCSAARARPVSRRYRPLRPQNRFPGLRAAPGVTSGACPSFGGERFLLPRGAAAQAPFRRSGRKLLLCTGHVRLIPRAAGFSTGHPQSGAQARPPGRREIPRPARFSAVPQPPQKLRRSTGRMMDAMTGDNDQMYPPGRRDRGGLLRAISARQQASSRLRSVTAGVGVASVLGGVVVAATLPGSAHSASASTSGQGSSASSGSGSSAATAHHDHLRRSSAPASSSGTSGSGSSSSSSSGSGSGSSGSGSGSSGSGGSAVSGGS